MARRQSVTDPVSEDSYDEMDQRIATHFERVRTLLDEALDGDDASDSGDN